MKKLITILIAVAIMLSAIPVVTPVEAEVEFMLGDVNGDGIICITDSVLILHFIDNNPTMFDNDERALKAALIRNPGATKPTIVDMLQVLLYLSYGSEILGKGEFGDCECCLQCLECNSIHALMVYECGCVSCELTLKCRNGFKGNVTGGCDITMTDALQVLMYIANVPQSVLFKSEQAYQAACITGHEPGISDVLQILMYLANIESSKLFG